MINMSELLKKLTILQNVSIMIYSDINYRKLYNLKRIQLIDGIINNFARDKLTDEYLSHQHEVYTGRSDKTYTNNWITYQHCTNALLKYTNNKCNLFIQVDEGNFYDGKFEKNRWKGTFDLNLSDISLFENDIDEAFNDKINDIFEKEEEIRIQKQKDEIRKRLLNRN